MMQGFYECERENKTGNSSSRHSLYSVQVAVVPLQKTYNTHESTFQGMSGNTIQFFTHLHNFRHDVLKQFKYKNLVNIVDMKY